MVFYNNEPKKINALEEESDRRMARITLWRLVTFIFRLILLRRLNERGFKPPTYVKSKAIPVTDRGGL
jgi:superfamily II DNA/RNA helicase